MKRESEQASERASERGGKTSKTAVRTFHDVLVWQRAMELAEAVYAATKSFPSDERFGPLNQMRRAAVSVPSNIAQGHARRASPDYLRMLRIARGSLAELETQSLLASRLGFMPADSSLPPLAREVAAMLNGLIVALERKEPQS